MKKISYLTIFMALSTSAYSTKFINESDKDLLVSAFAYEKDNEILGMPKKITNVSKSSTSDIDIGELLTSIQAKHSNIDELEFVVFVSPIKATDTEYHCGKIPFSIQKVSQGTLTVTKKLECEFTE